MSKRKARGPQSYENESLLLRILPDLLLNQGFARAQTVRQQGMKFLDAETIDGHAYRFWIKQGWTDAIDHCAIQFGLFKNVQGDSVSDQEFVTMVSDRVMSAKKKGATHALLVHMIDGKISDHTSLPIDEVTNAYITQIQRWPKRARNTKTPTLWFEDSRPVAGRECIEAVTQRAISFGSLTSPLAAQGSEADSEARRMSTVLEVRTMQERFRLRVGQRCGWQCVVSGTDVPEILDAAHLPGKNWRHHNSAEDGIMLRVDLHRLLDSGLAAIRNGTFWLSPDVRKGEYIHFHGRVITIAKP